ncbi:uncharacterized protein LOC105282637 isoform X2 [Ooceraea biroi]|uniref:Cyclin-T n=1 Tax=Ooceraea biroi TaxID=2015173 RepID=A0A026X142_OOCBI|nr:uncharacterized protein LOC105282637 isoform X2 [Ooceraea biroi]EZA61716.1 Cyclin-T [Ooceraea biroi]
MASDEKWYFTKEQLANSPSKRCGIDADKELSYRQQAANFIQDMGQRLVVSQLCINTAIVYMHRFYVFHSLTQFHRNAIAVAALFLAAKVEEQPRKLEHVIKMAYMCLHRDQPPPDSRSEQFLEQAQDLVFNENVLLQTLGFDVAIDHPHTHVVRCCQLVKASKDLAQTSYFMASNSLHLTTMCLQYKPTVVACFCIHLACKWSNWEIPQSTEGRQWFWYVDRTVTSEQLAQLTSEFLHIFDKCPSRLKRKIMSISANQSPIIHQPSLPNSPFDAEPHKIQSPVMTMMDGISHSSRSHHMQPEKQEKQDEKKAGATVGPSTSRAAVDYREYREKKERERLEREKAAAAAIGGGHLVDPKHHSHHHKPVTNPSVPSKHQMPSVQKGTTLHHNHHHRPDMKVGQPVQPQRHSISSQPREPNRDPSRQRLPREPNVGVAHSSHAHVNLDSSSSESALHRTDGASQDLASSMHTNLQEKLSNNNHSGHRLNALDSKHQQHDKRMYRGEDPRLKSAKYADMNRIENQRRKAETLEQRCEEVRKLIEKPLPPPKQVDVPYLMNAQQKQQQPHHSKYSQQAQDKSQGVPMSGDVKHATGQNALPQDKSPVSTLSSQALQKTVPAKAQIHNPHTTQGVSQILKDTIKNGSQSSLSSMDDPKSEKRSRTAVHETAEKNSAERNSAEIQQQSSHVHTPPSKHRSLFSPETPTPREPHVQRPKSKQKTPPSVVKIKQEPRASPFASPSTSQDSVVAKRPIGDSVASSHKRLRTSSIGESEPPIKIKTEIKIEDASSLEAMKLLGRVPDLIQPIRDNSSLSSNGRSSGASLVMNDLNLPELNKPFEPDTLRFNAMTQHKVSSMNVHALTNGIDLNIVKQESLEHCKKEPLEHYSRKETSGHRVPEPLHPHLQSKLEYTSPMKSAQSISALLQETLAPMPSLLQGLQQHTQVPAPQMHQELQQQQQQQHHHHLQQHQQQQSISHSLMDHQLPMTTQCLSVPTTSDNLTPIASTVDISALSCVPMTQSSGSTTECVLPTTSASTTVVVVPPAEEKRSEHHKSEKKKKKEKHKHKDKDKSKEKHKHKHKDKDKEKHREKKVKGKSEETPTAARIKITIPKDKLNLSTESSPNVNSGSGTSTGMSDKNISSQSTRLKIKIPKDRLKSNDGASASSPAQPAVMQGPLKIKIRTDGIPRSSAAAQPSLPPLPPQSSSSSSSVSTHLTSTIESSANETNRKRALVEPTGDNSTISGCTPAKKQPLMPPTSYSQGHRPGERQNGRHYNSGSNNKVRGGGRGDRQQHRGRGPPPHHPAAGDRHYYLRDGYSNERGSQNHCHLPPHHSYQSHNLPVTHGDVSGYARVNQSQVGQIADSYFYGNYPMFNAPPGYVYDPAVYQQFYQQFQQQQQQSSYPLFTAGNNLIVTPDGTIDTSVPPPLLLPNRQIQNARDHLSTSSVRRITELASAPPPLPPPLPSGPPPPTPPPPPPSVQD